MGGFGSGRRSGGGCTTVETCKSLDVDRLHAKGCLRDGWSGSWHWTRGGERIGAITMRAERDRLHLSYRLRIDGGDWENVGETVGIVRVPCHLGGARPYFICPGVLNGVACRRRVSKLYGVSRYFLCRHCYQLVHTSQSESAWNRALRRARKLRQRLGGEPGLDDPLPPKPKRMWQRTYDRLLDQAIEADTRAEDAFISSSEQLLARIDSHTRPSPSRKRSFWR